MIYLGSAEKLQPTNFIFFALAAGLLLLQTSVHLSVCDHRAKLRNCLQLQKANKKSRR
jgi:hypothetical protein